MLEKWQLFNSFNLDLKGINTVLKCFIMVLKELSHSPSNHLNQISNNYFSSVSH